MAKIEAAGGKAIPLLADVAQEQEVEAMFAAAIKRFGRLDILVANAGVQRDAPIAEMTLEAWRAVIDVRVNLHLKIDELLERAKAIARDIAGESGYSDGIIKPPEVLGVERFEDFHPVIRIAFVTRPPMKDAVRREFLRRWKMGLEAS